MDRNSILRSARNTFASNLRAVRKLKGLSQEALSLDAGLSRTYVNEVEAGTRNVSIDNMGALADALGVPLKSLVDPDIFARMKEQFGGTEKSDE